MDTVNLTNGTVDVTVALGEGLRIVRYAFVGEANVLASAPDAFTDTALGRWRPIGGHRLWVAPERMPGSYAPDATPVRVEPDGPLVATFTAPADAAGIGKRLRIELGADGGTVVRVTHTITNHTCWPARIAPWAITVAAPGRAVIPQPTFRPHSEDFLPARLTALWPYTDLSDPRWALGRRLLSLTPDRSRPQPQKIGAANEHGWCAVIGATTTFLKYAEWYADAVYPDLGCNAELFTAGDYLEVETLAPLRVVEPGGTATHVVRWALARDVDAAADEDTLERQLRGHVPLSR